METLLIILLPLIVLGIFLFYKFVPPILQRHRLNQEESTIRVFDQSMRPLKPIQEAKLLEQTVEKIHKFDTSVQEANKKYLELAGTLDFKSDPEDNPKTIAQRIGELITPTSTAAMVTGTEQLLNSIAEHAEVGIADLIEEGTKSLVSEVRSNPEAVANILRQTLHIYQDVVTLNARELWEHLQQLPAVADQVHDWVDHLHDNILAGHLESGVAVNPDDSLHVFPFLTLLRSSYQQAKLLLSGKTDWKSALKMVGLDLTGSAGGKVLGLVFLEIFAPGAGWAASAAVSTVSAVLGTVATRGIKNENLRVAIEDYKAAVQRFEQEDVKAWRALAVTVEQSAETEKKAYIEQIAFPPVANHAKITESANKLKEVYLNDLDYQTSEVESATLTLRRSLQDQWYHSVIGGRLAAYAEQKFTEKESYMDNIQRLRGEVPIVEDILKQPDAALLQLAGSKAVPGREYKMQVENQIIVLENLLKEQAIELANWTLAANMKLQIAKNTIAKTVQDKRTEQENQLKQLEKDIREKQNRVKLEMGKLGLNPG